MSRRRCRWAWRPPSEVSETWPAFPERPPRRANSQDGVEENPVGCLNRILPPIFVGSCPGTAADIGRLGDEFAITAVLNVQTDEDFPYWDSRLSKNGRLPYDVVLLRGNGKRREDPLAETAAELSRVQQQLNDSESLDQEQCRPRLTAVVMGI